VEAIFMVGPGRQLASLRHAVHCSGSSGGTLPRWFKV